MHHLRHPQLVVYLGFDHPRTEDRRICLPFEVQQYLHLLFLLQTSGGNYWGGASAITVKQYHFVIFIVTLEKLAGKYIFSIILWKLRYDPTVLYLAITFNEIVLAIDKTVIKIFIQVIINIWFTIYHIMRNLKTFSHKQIISFLFNWYNNFILVEV